MLCELCMPLLNYVSKKRNFYSQFSVNFCFFCFVSEVCKLFTLKLYHKTAHSHAYDMQSIIEIICCSATKRYEQNIFAFFFQHFLIKFCFVSMKLMENAESGVTHCRNIFAPFFLPSLSHYSH